MIALCDLKKSFGKVDALRGVTLDVPRGSVGLLGPNGAGKSTLIRILLGLLKPTSGSASVLDIDSAARPLDVRKRVGYMPEDDCHIPGLSAVKYVAFAAQLSGFSPDDAIQRAHEVLDYVGMVEERYRDVETYSTGMRQRIKLAQAIVHDPEVLLLDEPSNGMDPAGRNDMIELIRDIASLGDVSVLVSSHLLPDVEEVCRHIIVLGMGTVRLSGGLEDLSLTQGNIYELGLKGETAEFLAGVDRLGGVLHLSSGKVMRVTMPGEVTAKQLIELAHGTHVQIRHLRRARNTLEEVFMQALSEKQEDALSTSSPKEADHADP